jgi:hypothetical protein
VQQLGQEHHRCAYAEISASEPFDVTMLQIMTLFLRHPLAASLPRSSRSGSRLRGGSVKAAINDIGTARPRPERPSRLRVLVGGGTATMAVSGQVLFDFLPVEDMRASPKPSACSTPSATKHKHRTG